IYIYKDGLARFATRRYKKPSNKNIKDMFCHLTNYAINKNSKKFTFNSGVEDDDKGHKRIYRSILEFFKNQGENVVKLEEDID
ncbi:hypothetical protein ABFV62_30725, partial [Pseudomonas syringae]|uniref:hypothetical protein n=1 Tax=Pseudomonas syringae TaxID=317 RepID=UPI0034D4348A